MECYWICLRSIRKGGCVAGFQGGSYQHDYSDSRPRSGLRPARGFTRVQLGCAQLQQGGVHSSAAACSLLRLDSRLVSPPPMFCVAHACYWGTAPCPKHCDNAVNNTIGIHAVLASSGATWANRGRFWRDSNYSGFSWTSGRPLSDCIGPGDQLREAGCASVHKWLVGRVGRRGRGHRREP
jgi:hypothetical protein